MSPPALGWNGRRRFTRQGFPIHDAKRWTLRNLVLELAAENGGRFGWKVLLREILLRVAGLYWQPPRTQLREALIARDHGVPLRPSVIRGLEKWRPMRKFILHCAHVRRSNSPCSGFYLATGGGAGRELSYKFWRAVC